MRNEEIEDDNNDLPSSVPRVGRKYGPVVAHDHDPVILEMTSFDHHGSSSSNNKLVSTF